MGPFNFCNGKFAEFRCYPYIIFIGFIVVMIDWYENSKVILVVYTKIICCWIGAEDMAELVEIISIKWE